MHLFATQQSLSFDLLGCGPAAKDHLVRVLRQRGHSLHEVKGVLDEFADNVLPDPETEKKHEEEASNEASAPSAKIQFRDHLRQLASALIAEE